MHPYDEAVVCFMQNNDVAEARQWLSKAGSAYGVIHEMTHHESQEIVEEAYARGAVLVEAVGTIEYDPKESSVDVIVITLPKVKKDRAMLFELEAAVFEGTGFMPSIDEGQDYILLRWT